MNNPLSQGQERNKPCQRQVNIACLQTCPRPDFKSSLDEAIALAETAIEAGADMLTLPEYCGGLETEGSAKTETN